MSYTYVCFKILTLQWHIELVIARERTDLWSGWPAHDALLPSRLFGVVMSAKNKAK